MIVRDLIKELESLPQDMPVVAGYDEIKRAKVHYSQYILDNNMPQGYIITPAVVLE